MIDHTCLLPPARYRNVFHCLRQVVRVRIQFLRRHLLLGAVQ